MGLAGFPPSGPLGLVRLAVTGQLSPGGDGAGVRTFPRSRAAGHDRVGVLRRSGLDTRVVSMALGRAKNWVLRFT